MTADPINADDGYPSEAELQRIRDWPTSSTFPMQDLMELMDYVRVRWSYPQYWVEHEKHENKRHFREYEISTGGWSGNESLIGALKGHQMFNIIAPWSWRRGGHYVYRIPYDS